MNTPTDTSPPPGSRIAKRLEVVLSVHCARPTGQPVRATVTTVVHTKNRLGRLYMLPVKPMHRLI